MDAFNLIEDITNFVDSNGGNSEIDNDYYEIEDMYKEMFGHGVPREMLPNSFSQDIIKEAMNQCIENKQDDLFSILNVEIDFENIY